MLQEVTGIEVEEFGISELSELVFNVEIFRLLGRHFMGGWESIEMGEIVRDVGCLATFVAVHGCCGILQEDAIVEGIKMSDEREEGNFSPRGVGRQC